jgi:hypothetical protein
VRLTPDAIGLSKWWEARELDGGSYEIKITLGSGDCPAGCIERQTWTFNVMPDGSVIPVAAPGGTPAPS